MNRTGRRVPCEFASTMCLVFDDYGLGVIFCVFK